MKDFKRDYFKQIDSANKAYILGFIAADGNNMREGFRVQIHPKDKDVLEKIQDEIGEATIKCSDKVCGIHYYSTPMSKDLTKLGVPPAKTHIQGYVTIDEKYDRDFIRGVFDGDGSIVINQNYYNRTQISITGNNLLIHKIREKINKITHVKGYITTRKKETPNIISLTYSGTKSCYGILKWLYGDSELYLNRKYNLWLKVKKIQESRFDEKAIKQRLKTLKQEIKINKQIEEENLVISLLNKGYSIRQIMIQYGIDKRKTRKIIERKKYPYGSRRRMFSVDPNREKTS